MKYLPIAFMLLTGCGEKVAAQVNCVTTAAPAVECDVKQTKGKSEIEVCWDFDATCANGVEVKAPNTCQKVKDGGTVKVTIPADKLAGVDKCGGDKPPQAKMTNMTINGKPST
jgi:hypothetical protein